MLSDLLWLMGAKQQHDGQRSAGLAGLIFLILTFLAVMKWNDWIYPVLEWSGLVGLADRVGLISDSSHITMFNVVAMILFLIFAYAILSFVLVMLGLIIPAFLSSKVGIFLTIIILGPILFIPLLVYGYFWKKKQNAPEEETSTEKFMREYHEKQQAKYNNWLQRFDEAPNTSAISTDTKQMIGFDRSLWAVTPADSDDLPMKLTNFYAWGSNTRDIEPQLDLYRENVIVFNIATGKFSMVLPNPLPVMVSAMYDKPFENEGVLLEALRLYKEEYPLSDQHIFPTLELEIINTLERSYFAPAKNAVITPLKIADNDKNYERYYIKNQHNFYRTIKELNKRSDVQELLNRINLNALLLHEIVESHGIDPQTKPDTCGKLWGNVDSYKELFSAQISAALQKLNYTGYNWS